MDNKLNNTNCKKVMTQTLKTTTTATTAKHPNISKKIIKEVKMRLMARCLLFMAGCKFEPKYLIATDNKLGIPVGFSAQRRRRYKHFCPQWGMASLR